MQCLASIEFYLLHGVIATTCARLSTNGKASYTGRRCVMFTATSPGVSCIMDSLLVVKDAATHAQLGAHDLYGRGHHGTPMVAEWRARADAKCPA